MVSSWELQFQHQTREANYKKKIQNQQFLFLFLNCVSKMKIESVLFVFVVIFSFSQAEEVEDETTIAPLPNIEYGSTSLVSNSYIRRMYRHD